MLRLIVFVLMIIIVVACKEEVKGATSSSVGALTSVATDEEPVTEPTPGEPDVAGEIKGTITASVDGEEETAYILSTFPTDEDQYVTAWWQHAGGGTYQVTLGGKRRSPHETLNRFVVYAYFDADLTFLPERSSFVQHLNWVTEPSEITAKAEWIGEPGEDGLITLSGTFAGDYVDGDEVILIRDGVFEVVEVKWLGPG